ncbi:MAG: type II toxin-antitoxin system HicB family antitoxin [Candidatus Riflebacteria bacterium]|nr:type II toxin-antitoxin system HicB family antitoxin [Candidatus Riflebacteria bacterium]
MKIEFSALFEPQKEGGFTVTFPDIPEAITEGDTMEEAIFNAQEILTGCLEQRIEDSENIPLPEVRKGKHFYSVSPSAAVQSAILVRLSKNGKSLADIARALGTSWPAVQRLENPKHSPTLKQLERAAAALGKRLILSFE